MAAKSTAAPEGAFLDPDSPPGEADVKSALKRSYPALAKLRGALHAAHPTLSQEWHYARRSGWYEVGAVKKRRLYYLLPKPAGFRVNMVLGGKAIALLSAGPHATETTRRVTSAPRYPEGTLFSFNPGDCDPAFVVACLAAKLAH